jgi:hypothetical protein
MPLNAKRLGFFTRLLDESMPASAIGWPPNRSSAPSASG